MKVPHWLLRERQAYPLEQKIELSRAKIKEWYEYWDGMVYVAFSGGRDSTALLHLVRSIYPSVPGVFCNTGLEYPEIVDFVHQQDNITIIRPEMNFKKVIEQYGYPVVTKEIAYKIRAVRRNPSCAVSNYYMTGYKSDGVYKRRGMISEKWKYLVDAPFAISEQCCDVMKKRPFRKYQKQSRRMPILGNMAVESGSRIAAYRRHGCIVTDKGKEKCTPIAFWVQHDIANYLSGHSISIADPYQWGIRATGCIFCAFGAHTEEEPNRFQNLKIVHPKLWKYCMDKLGMREVLDYINVPYE